MFTSKSAKWEDGHITALVGLNLQKMRIRIVLARKAIRERLREREHPRDHHRERHGMDARRMTTDLKQ